MVMMNLFVGQQTHRHREQTCGHSGGWGEERVGQTERVALKHILLYVKQITSENLLHDARELNPVLWDNLEGWTGWEEGGSFKRVRTYVYL